MTRRNFTWRGGFTLLEMLIVMMIVSIGAALAVPAFRQLFQEDDLTEARRKVEGLLWSARDSAVRGGDPVTVVIDSATGMVWLGSLGGEPLDLLELPPTVRLEVPRARARFTFTRTGMAFADSLMLTSPTGDVVLTVDRRTGDAVVR